MFEFNCEDYGNDYNKMAEDFLKFSNTDFHVVGYRGVSKMPWQESDLKMDKWEVRLRRNGKEWRFNFYMGLGNKKRKPTAYDVLACLTKGDAGSFEDFCSDYGYDMVDDYGRQNANTYGLYKAVCREYKHVVSMFYDCLDELCEIS